MRYLALHGFTGDGADFSALSLFVGGEWDCPDLPGHGGQGRAAENDFAVPGLADRLLGPENSTEPRIGIGYSLGGRLLLHLAFLRPQAFSQLILIGASPGLRTASERSERTESDRRWIHQLRSSSMEEFLRDWWDQPIMAGLRNLPAEERETLRKRRLSNDPEGLIRSLKHHGTGALPSLWDRLPDLTIPVRLLVGEWDRKFQRIAGEMAELLPNATLATIPGSGHGPHLENPENLAREIVSDTTPPPESP